MDVSTDGELAALDFGNRRVSVFSPDGTLVREIRLRPSAGRPGYGRDALRWDERGQLWISLNPPRSGLDTLRAGQQRPLFGRLIGHEAVTDTVFLPTRAWEDCERRSPGHSGGSMEDNRLRHMPFAQWTRSRTGVLAFGCAATYAIDVVRSDGGVTRMSRAWDPPVRTDEEHEYWDDGFRVQNMRRRSDNETLARLGRGAESRSLPSDSDPSAGTSRVPSTLAYGRRPSVGLAGSSGCQPPYDRGATAPRTGATALVVLESDGRLRRLRRGRSMDRSRRYPRRLGHTPLPGADGSVLQGRHDLGCAQGRA